MTLIKTIGQITDLNEWAIRDALWLGSRNNLSHDCLTLVPQANSIGFAVLVNIVK